MREIKFRAWHKGSREMLHSSPADIFIWQHEKQPIELMQFTGLLDKNGKEIYEGDIVESEHFLPSEVRFVSGCFMAEDISLGNIDIPYENNEWEVIGNIYEDPELLEGK